MKSESRADQTHEQIADTGLAEKGGQPSQCFKQSVIASPGPEFGSTLFLELGTEPSVELLHQGLAVPNV
jgi:hypothetical protein